MRPLPHPVQAIGSIVLLSAAIWAAQGQPANAPTPDPLSQLMVSQPSIEVVTNPVATASFDPPVVRTGGLSTYRIAVNALDDSIKLPESIVVPPTLDMRQSARGQILVFVNNRLLPQSMINYHVRAGNAGTFTIEPFPIEVYGRTVTVPAARLSVVPTSATALPPGRRLTVEVPTTNVFVGQSVNVQVVLTGSPVNMPQRLTQVRINGDGFLVDHAKARQSEFVQSGPGQSSVTSIYELPITPLTAGELRFSAQGYTTANLVNGPFVISNQPLPPGATGPEVLLDSDPITLNVRPLPRTGALPGFTGAIGTFALEPPRLSATQVNVGEPVKLICTIRGDGNLARLVPPPPPATPEWQVSEATMSSAPGFVIQMTPTSRVVRPVSPGGPTVSFTYDLIPLVAGLAATPAIPFSYFDPERGAYEDLTIPSLPLEVRPGVLTNAARLWAEAGLTAADTNQTLVLSAPATSPGRVIGSLVPLQLDRWFVFIQLLPALGFAGLWFWVRHRRYLEDHPDLVRRQQARRALRKERRILQKALAAANAVAYAEAAVRAMRVACAPHFPAEPRALVGRDVLEVCAADTGNVKPHSLSDATYLSEASLVTPCREPRSSRREEAHSHPGEGSQSLFTSAATVQGSKVRIGPGNSLPGDLEVGSVVDSGSWKSSSESRPTHAGIGDTAILEACAATLDGQKESGGARAEFRKCGGKHAAVVQEFFAVADASRFSVIPGDASRLFALSHDLERLLQELEARL